MAEEDMADIKEDVEMMADDTTCTSSASLLSISELIGFVAAIVAHAFCLFTKIIILILI